MERISAMLPEGDADADLHRGARRASQRHAFDADVELIEPRPAHGVVINASTGGMRIALDQPLTVGDLCVARLITGTGRELIEKARVVWTRELPDGWLAGLRFVADN